MGGPFSVPGFDPSSVEKPPHISTFDAHATGFPKLGSMNVPDGTSVTLTWTIEGQVDQLELQGIKNSGLDPSERSFIFDATEDVTLYLAATNSAGDTLK